MMKTTALPDIQSIISIGYLYLILLGILNETFFYNQMGINILKYTAIMDVLLSPIALLTSKFSTIIIFTIVIFTVFRGPSFIAKNKDKKWIRKVFSLDDTLSVAAIEKQFLNSFLVFLIIILLGFFVGTGIGKGERINSEIKENKVKFVDKLTFVDNSKEAVKIVGNNSVYIFYLIEGDRNVKITPINGILKRIEDIKESKLEDLD